MRLLAKRKPSHHHAVRRRDRDIVRVDHLHDVGHHRLQLPAGPVPHAVSARQGVQSAICQRSGVPPKTVFPTEQYRSFLKKRLPEKSLDLDVLLFYSAKSYVATSILQ